MLNLLFLADGLLSNPMSIVWFVIIVTTIIIEILTVDLTTIWFTVGAIISLILAAFNVPVIVQIIVFLTVSIVLIATVGKWTRRLFNKKTTPTNIGEAIGQEIVILKDADEFNYGEGKYRGLFWTIAVEHGESVKTGDVAIVEKVDGNKLVVKKASKDIKGGK